VRQLRTVRENGCGGAAIRRDLMENDPREPSAALLWIIFLVVVKILLMWHRQ